ncbi:MAG: histidine kinase [Burkholderiales bacterium]|nr:histidine kinase [Burkholderiales bacterium]
MAHSAAQFQTDGKSRPHTGRRLLPEWRPLLMVAVVAIVAAGFLQMWARNTFIELLGETLFVGVVLLLAFRAASAWSRTWMPRWVAQLVAVLIAAAFAPLVVQLVTTSGDFSAFLASRSHVRGYILVTFYAAIIGSVLALGALFRERDAALRARELQFALEREMLERQAADARLHLMTAQIQPHFLLNTLANVQELVESGSPRAVPLFRSLIGYLRVAVPQLQQDHALLGDEERLVRAYLELMQMRMPDRLTFRIDVDPALQMLRFPPMALLTLVENSIRHGVDPSVEPSVVEVHARREDDGTLHLWVADTGAGMSETAGEGTGLANLRARLKAFFGEGARLELSEQAPHGLRADLRLPMPQP